MPKLLQIDSCLNITATGRINEGIGMAAQKRGWDSYIVHGARSIGKSNQKTIQASSFIGEIIHGAFSITLDNHGLNSTFSTKRLIRKIEDINPDVIQLHCIHGYYINYKLLFEYLRESGKPVVWTFHDCWPFTGHCCYFNSNGCEKWKTGCHHCELKQHYPKCIGLDRSDFNYKLKNRLFNSVERMTIVPVSYWLDGLVEESFLKNIKRQVIYNGVDLNRFYYRESDIRRILGIDNKFVLIAVAAFWSKGKGWNDYLKLSEMLGDDCQMIMLGVTAAQQKQLPPKILGVGRTSSVDELCQYYSLADVVLNLSHYETFGMTTVEGMACGTPSIVYNCTASPELIDPNTGYLTEIGDFEAVLNSVNTIRSKGKQSYSDACKKRVSDVFDQYKNYNKYIDLYESLI